MNSTALRADRADLGRVSNLVKTTVLLAALSALVLGFGSVLGGARGVMISGVIVLVMNFVSFWFSDRIALAMNRAQPLDPRMVPHVTDLVSRLAARAGLPMPKLYFIDSPTPNAFATGRSPDKAAIAVTRGLLETMGQRELTGVLAHELAHVKHRDTLIMTVAATLAGVISHAAQALFWFGGSMLNRGDDEEGPSTLGLLGAAMVAPLTATMLQLAISRSREFEADAAAAKMTGDPLGLANALARLEAGNQQLPMNYSPATAHLFIVNPLAGGALLSLFATHPPMEQRIERLHAMA
jgi:heat shock protein HtpX